MHDIDGKEVHITGFTYKCDVHGLRSQRKAFSPDITGEKDGMPPADSLYLTPPDSRKKPEENSDSGECICGHHEDCPTEMYGKPCPECKKAALENIASRIREPRGGDR